MTPTTIEKWRQRGEVLEEGCTGRIVGINLPVRYLVVMGYVPPRFTACWYVEYYEEPYAFNVQQEYPGVEVHIEARNVWVRRADGAFVAPKEETAPVKNNMRSEHAEA